MPAASYKGVLKHYESSPADVKSYFESTPELVEGFPYEVCIAYMFSRIERAQNMTLYCGVVKIHQADKEIAQNVIQRQHITRESFSTLFETIFGEPLGDTVVRHLGTAEKVRDRVVHGKEVKEPDLRKAIIEVLDYACGFNDRVDKLAGFRPFGDLRGFKGRAAPLGKSTTRWLLRGLGFTAA